MADLPPHRDPQDDIGERPDRGSDAGTPRWVKVFGIIAIILVLLVAVVVLTGVGGPHGPGRHAPSGDAGGDTQTSSVTDHRTPPDRGRG